MKLVQQKIDHKNLPYQQAINYPLADQMSLRINADNSRPRDILCFWLVFFIVIATCVILAVFVAPKQIILKSNVIQLKDTLDHSCMNPCGFQNNTLICNPFGKHNPYLGLLMRHISVLNQFALVYIQFDDETGKQFSQESEKLHEITQQIQIVLFSMNLISENKVGRFIKRQQLGSHKIQLKDTNQTKSFTLYGQQIRHLIGFYRETSQQNYLLVVKFTKPQQIISNGMSPVLKGILINSQFSIFIIIVRLVGFIVTLITGTIYFINYRKIQPSLRSIQQKLVLTMSILVLFFNDPTYWISIYKPNIFLSILSIIFLTQFIAFLFFFWDFIAIRIYKEEGQLHSRLINKKIIIISIIYFGSYFSVLSWHYSGIAMAAYQGHFIVNPQLLSQNLTLVFQFWLLINVTLYGFVAVQTIQFNKATLWRSRSWIYFNIYFAILITIFVTVTGSLYQQNSKLLLMTYTSINMYCIYMQYMFSPSFYLNEAQTNNLIPISNISPDLYNEQGDTVIEMESMPRNKLKKIARKNEEQHSKNSNLSDSQNNNSIDSN